MNINTEFIYYIGVLTIICYVSYCFLGIVNKIFKEYNNFKDEYKKIHLKKKIISDRLTRNPDPNVAEERLCWGTSDMINTYLEEEHICKIETPADVEGKEIIELIDSRPNGDIYITQVALRKLIKDMYILANRKS